MTDAKVERPQAIWIVSPVWGRSYCEFFADYCIPSLITDRNIEALKGYPTTFVIYTKKGDVSFLKEKPSLSSLEQRFDVRYVPIDLDDLNGATIDNYRLITKCHDDVVVRGAAADAGLFFMMPDTVCSEGSLARSLELVEEGCRAVMLAGLRAVRKTLCQGIEQYRQGEQGSALSIPPRSLISLYLNDLLPASQACFHNGHGNHISSMHFWPLDDWGFLARCYHLHPFFLWPQNKKTRLYSTLDLDMVRQAIQDRSKIHIVTDSDEISCVEGSDSERFEEVFPELGLTPYDIAEWAYNNTNDLHRRFAKTNIVFRTRDGDAPPELQREADQVIDSHTSALHEMYGDDIPDFVLNENIDMQKALYYDLIQEEKKGSYGSAWRIVHELRTLQNGLPGRLSLQEWLLTLKPLAVGLSLSQKIFAFSDGMSMALKDVDVLADLENFLNSSPQKISVMKDFKLLRDNLGRGMAYLAPRDPDFFEKAEWWFSYDAGKSSTYDLDKRLNLFHLYIDWGRLDRAEEQLSEMLSYFPLFKILAARDGRPRVFLSAVLAAWLKWKFINQQDISDREWDALAQCDIKSFFRKARYPHTCHLVGGYIGILAAGRGNDYQDVDRFFRQSLNLASNSDPLLFPEQQAVHTQVLTWLALITAGYGMSELAGKLIRYIQNTLERFSRRQELSSMLVLDQGKAVGGWFAPGWNALSEVDWTNSFDNDACRTYLNCFTFNYS